MKYMHVAIWVDVELRGIYLDGIVILRSTIKLFSITQSTKDLDMLTTRDYYGTFQYCQIHICNDCICMFCETWIEIAWLSETLVKHDCQSKRLTFSVNVKLFFEFFVMREMANYFYVKLFSEEVQGTLSEQNDESQLKRLKHWKLRVASILSERDIKFVISISSVCRSQR